MAEYNMPPGCSSADIPGNSGVDEDLIELSEREQRGLVKGLTMALKYARVAKRGRSGQLELIGYLESQLKLAKEVPF